MAGVDATRTSYGIVFTCTSGTAAAAVLIPKEQRLEVTGVHFAGAATSDIITVNDAAGNLVAKGYGGTGLSNHNLTFAKPIEVQGLAVGIAGATTGVAVVYCK